MTTSKGSSEAKDPIRSRVTKEAEVWLTAEAGRQHPGTGGTLLSPGSHTPAPLAPKPPGALRRQGGSPGYAALELISGGPYGAEADNVGAGVVLFFALSWWLPFRGDKVLDIPRWTVRALESGSGSPGSRRAPKPGTSFEAG